GVSFLNQSTIPALSQYRSVKDIYLLGGLFLSRGSRGRKRLNQVYYTLSTIYGYSSIGILAIINNGTILTISAYAD
ncbi:MAG: hypothetical protein ACYTX0_62355, partial [Nostoc sp.]